MNDVLPKRQHATEEYDDESLEHDTKRRETSKKMSKPGRKPLDTEPKNKRTAQNRAAQRAFRERKEQRMKDLEKKITTLEDDKRHADTEAEFLRLQVQMLMNELAKHRGSSDISDLKLPNGQQIAQTDISPQSDHSSTFSLNESSLKSVSSGDETHVKKPSFSFEFPWSRKNSAVNTPATSSSTTKSPLFSNASSNNVPSLSSNASTTSTTTCGTSPFELYNTEDQKDLPLFPQAKTLNNRANEQEFDFNGNFDEGISEFCTDLNTACGTKDCPVPKSKSQAATPVEPKKDLADSKTHDDALYFLNDNTNLLTGYSTFDPSLAFDNGLSNNFNNNLFDDEPQINESDPLASLTTEESVYDPFGLFTQLETSKDSPAGELNSPSVATLKTPNSVAAPSTGIIAEDDFNEIVPAKEQKYMKCTEIWDRITAHPKYSDIDIDGLCNELRAKAKCSDKGVVIDFHDVNNVIEKSLK